MRTNLVKGLRQAAMVERLLVKRLLEDAASLQGSGLKARHDACLSRLTLPNIWSCPKSRHSRAPHPGELAGTTAAKRASVTSSICSPLNVSAIDLCFGKLSPAGFLVQGALAMALTAGIGKL
jgi:hypothetical protein